MQQCLYDLTMMVLKDTPQGILSDSRMSGKKILKVLQHLEVHSQQQCVCEVAWKIEKEMLRQYDTDGDSTLSSAEIQASV